MTRAAEFGRIRMFLPLKDLMRIHFFKKGLIQIRFFNGHIQIYVADISKLSKSVF